MANMILGHLYDDKYCPLPGYMVECRDRDNRIGVAIADENGVFSMQLMPTEQLEVIFKVYRDTNLIKTTAAYSLAALQEPGESLDLIMDEASRPDLIVAGKVLKNRWQVVRLEAYDLAGDMAG